MAFVAVLGPQLFLFFSPTLSPEMYHLGYALILSPIFFATFILMGHTTYRNFNGSFVLSYIPAVISAFLIDA